MTRPRLGRELVQPLPLAATLLLVLNDHVLKGSGLVPGTITGKLSDFAGLFVFPVLLHVALDALTRRASSTRHRASSAWGAALITAAGFSLVKLAPPVNALASEWIGPMRLDPTDLVALPCCALAALWLTRRRDPDTVPSSAARLLAFVAIALACGATSSTRLVRAYPAWQIETLGARRIGCAVVEVWISKSGKQGLGATIEVTPQSSAGCQVLVRSARFSAGPISVDAAELPSAATARDKSWLYLPFAFDNNTLWNDEHHEGRLELVIQAGDREERLAFGARHVWTGSHRIRDLEPPADAGADAGSPLTRRDAQPPYQFAEPPP
jgi:hypothetical protein